MTILPSLVDVDVLYSALSKSKFRDKCPGGDVYANKLKAVSIAVGLFGSATRDLAKYAIDSAIFFWFAKEWPRLSSERAKFIRKFSFASIAVF